MSTRSVADAVTPDTGPDGRLAARELARRCEQRLDALVERVMTQWREHLPGYQLMRDEENSAVLRQAVRVFLRELQGDPADVDLRVLFRTRAARRAEQGVPLPTLLRTYTIAAHALFEEFRLESRAGEEAGLTEVARQMLITQDAAISEVASAYQEELAALGAARRDRRRELVRDLVGGSNPPEAAVLEEFGLGAGATVLAIRLGPLGTIGLLPQQRPDAESAPPPTESPLPAQQAVTPHTQTSQPDTPQSSNSDVPESTFSRLEVVIRRRLLRLQQALDSHFGRPVPALLEQQGGHVLVPHAAIGADTAAAGPAVTAELSRELSDIWGDEVRIAVADADHPERIGPVAATATEVLRLVSVLAKPPGVYTLDDVLLEYHLTRQDESTQSLGALLDPLTERPDLLRTLRVFLDEEYDRRRTARRLGLHPNTVDNRLSRVTELTGLDPSTPRGVALLMTALALRDLR
jgi:hypothetical protein